MANEADRKKKENPILRFLKILGNDIKDIGSTFVKGDWKTKCSYFIMGSGQIFRGQILKGLMYLAVQAGIICFIVFFGWDYLSKFGTLGTVETSIRDVSHSGATTVFLYFFSRSIYITLFYSSLLFALSAACASVSASTISSRSPARILSSL